MAPIVVLICTMEGWVVGRFLEGRATVLVLGDRVRARLGSDRRRYAVEVKASPQCNSESLVLFLESRPIINWVFASLVRQFPLILSFRMHSRKPTLSRLKQPRQPVAT